MWSSGSLSRVHVILDEGVGGVGGEFGGEVPVILWIDPRLGSHEQKDADGFGQHGGPTGAKMAGGSSVKNIHHG